MVMNDKPEKVS